MVAGPAQKLDFRVLGRYALYDPIGAGGMATVHLGRLLGEVGFSRIVAIKRLQGRFAQDPQFVAMFLDEAHMAARIVHPNVVPTIDVAYTSGELFLVMEYVPGESLSRLLFATREAGAPIPARIVSAIMSSVLHGLHAAHEARSESGEPLGIVHRDVSPQNVLVGADGVVRILDFGVAKAKRRLVETREGDLKGKLYYMSPEQIHGGEITRSTDVYAAGLLLWELLTGERFHRGGFGPPPSTDNTRPVDPGARSFNSLGATIDNITFQRLQNLDEVTQRALHTEPSGRFSTAREMALAIERGVSPAPPSEVAEWIEKFAGESIASRRRLVALIENQTSSSKPGASTLMRWLGAGRKDQRPRQRAPADSSAKLDPRSSGRVRPEDVLPPPLFSPVARGILYGAAAGVLVLAMIVLAMQLRAPQPLRPAADPTPTQISRETIPPPPTTPSVPPVGEIPQPSAPVTSSTAAPARATKPARPIDWNSRK
jgi:serine/threonine-protein kinase